MNSNFNEPDNIELNEDEQQQRKEAYEQWLVNKEQIEVDELQGQLYEPRDREQFINKNEKE